jgi:hypothetical protein
MILSNSGVTASGIGSRCVNPMPTVIITAAPWDRRSPQHQREDVINIVRQEGFLRHVACCRL